MRTVSIHLLFSKRCVPFFSALGFVVVGGILENLSVSIELTIEIRFKAKGWEEGRNSQNFQLKRVVARSGRRTRNAAESDSHLQREDEKGEKEVVQSSNFVYQSQTRANTQLFRFTYYQNT